MAFQRDRVVELVTDFYRENGAEEGTRFVVIPSLDEALNVALRSGIDARLADLPVRQTARTVLDIDEDRRVLRGLHQLVFRQAIERGSPSLQSRMANAVVIDGHAATESLREASGMAAAPALPALVAMQVEAGTSPPPQRNTACTRRSIAMCTRVAEGVRWPIPRLKLTLFFRS